jgi:hypothetical protein
MKNLPIVLISLFIFSCASTQYGSNSNNQRQEKDFSIYQTLGEALRSEGVLVRDVGTSATVTLRGKGSINLNTEPLYVVDGVPMGNNYETVNSSINMQNVKDIRIIRSTSQATLRYGEAGNHGAILITTKANDEGDSEDS